MILASGTEHISVTIAVIVCVGVGGQWLATKLKIPSVLLLLLAGIVVGPVTETIDPVGDLGPALFPVVGLAVGLLLFEGGLTLRLDRLIQGRSVVLRLVTIGTVLTWIIASVAVWTLFDVRPSVAGLIGAILVVSGPTVVIPLLQIARPREPSAAILRWEGIIIDPIGATLAIVMLDATINTADPRDATAQAALTLGAGTAVGFAAAGFALVAIRYHTIPDRLHNPVLLGLAIAAYAAANGVAPEAGLMATTALGLALANQRWVPAGGITAFSEDIAQLVLGSLFVTLGALVDFDDIVDLLPRTLPLIAILVVVARPVAVWASTVGTNVPGADRRYLAAMAPRGIVAASVATVFANTLAEETGAPVPELVPIVFTVVIGTVAIYGLTATLSARRFHVARPKPTGLAIVSNHPKAVALADELANAETTVLLVTTSRQTQRAALERGILTYHDALDDEQLEMALDALGIKTALIVTDDENLTSHAAHHLTEHLGRANIHHVGADQSSGHSTRHHRPAFSGATFDTLTNPRTTYTTIEATDLDRELQVPLFHLQEAIATVLNGHAPKGGRLIIAVVPPADPA